MCGSFCTHAQVLETLEVLTEQYETVIPIVSELTAFTDTRFGTSDALMERLEDLTGQEVLCDIPSVEPIGPKALLDVLVIAPATGNTIAKLAAGITDTAVTMAAKAHLRNGRPVLIGVSTNDALGISASYLSRKLKEKTGHTFNSLVTRYRLQQSLALLREGRLRVYEVAEQVGFGDYKNFAQAFRKYLAMTPSQFMQGL